jgi:hypothetical protein
MAACGGGSADNTADPSATAPNASTSSAPTMHALAAGGGGGGAAGGGGGGLTVHIATMHGLYVVDNPQPGEPSMRGWVFIAFRGNSQATWPQDLVVTVNGVPLIHDPAPGTAAGYYIVDPQGQQPVLGADGFLHVTASSRSAKTSRLLDLPCPAPVVITSTPAAGSSLGGAASLDLAWTALPQNAALFANGGFNVDMPNTRLLSYDVVTGYANGFLGQGLMSQGQAALGTSIPVLPSTSSESSCSTPGSISSTATSAAIAGASSGSRTASEHTNELRLSRRPLSGSRGTLGSH